jgi:hypothetical protein
MSIWWLIPAFVGLVGVLILVGGIGRFFKAKILSGLFRTLFGGLTLAGAAIIGLIGLNLQTYARLTHERLAAEITLKQTGQNQFTASVRKAVNDKGDLGAPKEFAVTGDQVRIEGPVWKMKPWANIMGADSFYRLDRVQGRWSNPEAENANKATAHSLDGGSTTGLDALKIAEAVGNGAETVANLTRGKDDKIAAGSFNPVTLDTNFGSGVYMPMADGAVYDVMITQAAFIVRGKNDVALGALSRMSEGLPPEQNVAPPMQDVPAQTTAPAQAPATPPT